MPPVAEIEPQTQHEARKISLGRIQEYGSIENVGGRNGAITREVGRVAKIDPEFALEIVRDFEPNLKINALTVIGKATAEVGPLSDARDHVESEGFEATEKSLKLAGIAKAAAFIDAEFAFETALAIQHSAPRVDTLLEVAKWSKFRNELNRSNEERFGADSKDINFSIDLLREMVREADQIIESSNTFRNDVYRNRDLAEISAGHELGVTYRAEKRRIEFFERTKPIDVDAVALHSVQGHIRGYIKEGDLEGLEEADPGSEVTIAAFKARVSEQGGDGDRLQTRMGFGDELLDPVTDAAELIRHLANIKSMTFQHPNPKLYRALLSVVSDGASAQLVNFDEEQKRQREEEEAAPAVDSW